MLTLIPLALHALCRAPPFDPAPPERQPQRLAPSRQLPPYRSAASELTLGQGDLNCLTPHAGNAPRANDTHEGPGPCSTDAAAQGRTSKARTGATPSHRTKGDTVIQIKDRKPEVLAALYNASQPQGLGFLHFTPEDMTVQQAAALLEEHTYFDYLRGRVMKVDFSGDELDPALYDRDNGEGAACRAVEAIPVSSET